MCQEAPQEIYGSVTEECQEAMCIRASQVMQERRGMLASLIGEVVAVAAEEGEVEVLRSIGNALL